MTFSPLTILIEFVYMYFPQLVVFEYNKPSENSIVYYYTFYFRFMHQRIPLRRGGSLVRFAIHLLLQCSILCDFNLAQVPTTVFQVEFLSVATAAAFANVSNENFTFATLRIVMILFDRATTLYSKQSDNPTCFVFITVLSEVWFGTPMPTDANEDNKQKIVSSPSPPLPEIRVPHRKQVKLVLRFILFDFFLFSYSGKIYNELARR